MTKRPVLIDTQLLVLLVVGLTGASLIERHKRTIDRKYTRTDFHLLLDLLGHAPRFVFCPHVATETSNLAGQHGEPERSAIMATLKALLNNAEDLRISCADAMGQPDYPALGLADAAQLALCTEDTVLLTDDEPLHRAAVRHGIAALRFRDEKFRRNRDLA